MFIVTSVDSTTGMVMQVVEVQIEERLEGGKLSGAFYVYEKAPDNSYWDFTSSSWLSIPEQPSIEHIFNWVTKEWEDLRTLQDLKKVAITKINEAWDTASVSSFSYLGKEFSTSASSRSDIDGINGYVALYSAFPEGWVGAWKATDNSYLPISTVDEWKAFYGAMITAGLANFTKAQTLKNLIQQSYIDTPEKVAAITW